MPSDSVAGYSFSDCAPTYQGAGRRPQVKSPGQLPDIDLHHRAQAAGRRLSISPDISPIYKAAGRRSSIREPLISITDAPSNKNRSEVEGSFAKKKLAPPQRECEQCQAICDLETLTLPFFTIFNSSHTGTPSMHRYTSGIPSPLRFSILSQCVFLGRFCFNSFHSDCSVAGILNSFHISKSMGVVLAETCQSGNNVFTRHIIKLMDVSGLAPIDGQAAQTGADFLSIDSGTELPSLFSRHGQFLESFKLAYHSDSEPALSGLSKFFDQFGYFRKRLAIEKLGSMVIGTSISISSKPSALSIRVFALDIILGKLPLSVGESSRSASFAYSVFYGFTVFQTKKSPLVSVRSGTVEHKWNSYNRCPVRIVPFVPFVPANIKKIKIFFVTQKKHYMALVFCIFYSHVLLCNLGKGDTVRYKLLKPYRFKVQGSRHKGTKR